MIIIAENKKNHYLIKKFLIESGIDRDHNDVQLNLRPVSNTQHNSDPRYFVQQDLKPVSNKNIYSDTEAVLPDDRKFKKLVAKEPKYNILKNIAAKGILTLAMVGLLWNSIPTNPSAGVEEQTYSAEQKSAEDQVERELINQNPEEKENISSTFDEMQNNESEENLVFSVEYDTSIDRDEIKQSIVAFEGFKSLPYPDHHQWSIGHGTKVHSNADIAKGQHEKLEKTYKEKLLKGKKVLARWIETQIPGWRVKFFNDYSIPNDNLSKNSSINRTQAGTAADQSVDHAISSMQKIEYFSVLPKNIKNAYFDMAYNMGPGFLKKFKKFNEAVKHAAIVLNNSDNNLNEDDIQVAIDLFEIAAEEIIYNFNDDGSYRGETTYFSDLKRSGRPQRNYELVKRGIEDMKIVVSPSHFNNQEKNESLKKVYKSLFV